MENMKRFLKVWCVPLVVTVVLILWVVTSFLDARSNNIINMNRRGDSSAEEVSARSPLSSSTSSPAINIEKEEKNNQVQRLRPTFNEFISRVVREDEEALLGGISGGGDEDPVLPLDVLWSDSCPRAPYQRNIPGEGGEAVKSNSPSSPPQLLLRNASWTKELLRRNVELLLSYGTRVSGDWTDEEFKTTAQKAAVSSPRKEVGNNEYLQEASGGWTKVFHMIKSQAECSATTPSSSSSSAAPYWEVSEDAFVEHVVEGTQIKLPKKKFKNIVAKFGGGDPTLGHLVLAAHFDSKWYQDPAKPAGERFHFVGACDSAVPVVMLLELMKRISTEERHQQQQGDIGVSFPAITILFFDGEEAFYDWKGTDNTYGSRHLATRWAAEEEDRRTTKTTARRTGQKEEKVKISNITLFALLDLMGPPNPTFHNYFAKATGPLFNRLSHIEKILSEGSPRRQRLLTKGQPSSRLSKGEESAPEIKYRSTFFNTGARQPGMIEDDHIPWLNRGVPILHLIPAPFPSSWHRSTDDAASVDYDTVHDLLEIFTQFVFTYRRNGELLR